VFLPKGHGRTATGENSPYHQQLAHGLNDAQGCRMAIGSWIVGDLEKIGLLRLMHYRNVALVIWKMCRLAKSEGRPYILNPS
jgi:hypothetical protein